MGGKSNYNAWSLLQLGYFYPQPPAYPAATGVSGATEPAWPASEGATVVDGGITWTAILARVGEGTVTGVLNQATFQHSLGAYPHHYFQYGKLTWVTGNNAGYSCDIRDSMGPISTGGGPTPPYVLMLEIAQNPIAVGDTFELTVGCPKIRSKCQEFNNMDNFRGFPDMPTEERALATPNQFQVIQRTTHPKRQNKDL